MQQADETFLTTTQEPRKLSIAISRYFSGELTEPDLKERYEKFCGSGAGRPCSRSSKTARSRKW